ncbi:UDP-N-acetylmuramyl pentapeptide phosphotransferase/UDP-N-acetylglucosamine-1-phosphate transferase [Paenibacillus sp. 1182]|uniref:hypothetical protein n=1 Tax=Paenibacillus sp. 1182 TaxID=2806565 RepID=UPI001AE90AF3|nr:hypothetical protein [Paenibacillus sp. 1182]MBP1309122.1 UDP-N-acetylmuramyl pentapeptide phosphotransferase/UDP-N-acetylglucosamine-1-phosphate transferase [Paenibacillus sp. 1182]
MTAFIMCLLVVVIFLGILTDRLETKAQNCKDEFSKVLLKYIPASALILSLLALAITIEYVHLSSLPILYAFISIILQLLTFFVMWIIHNVKNSYA